MNSLDETHNTCNLVQQTEEEVKYMMKTFSNQWRLGFQAGSEEEFNTNEKLQAEGARRRLRAVWNAARQEVVSFFGPLISEEHPAKTDSGKKTYAYKGNRFISIEHDMSRVLEDALARGNFSFLDDIIVNLIEGAQRHTQHGTGPPRATHACAKQVTHIQKKDANKKRGTTGQKSKSRTKRIFRCKRRFPRQRRRVGEIAKDPHNAALTHVLLPRNDPLLNGYNAFLLLTHMSNIDDKAVVPAWAIKEPELTRAECEVDDSVMLGTKKRLATA